MLRYTLVPEDFFSPEAARELLGRVVKLEPEEVVKYKELPQYKAVLVYVDVPASASGIASVAAMVEEAGNIEKYNRVVARYTEPEENGAGSIDIVLVSGPRLLFVNSFKVPDSVTAQYYIFATLRQFQINPELTAVYFHGEVPFAMKEDLFRYFPSVETI
ncbi:MAG: DUF3822 family protein [Bacteroidales bacterium]|nr:DUF3822 family protein [Candidatus Cacconaster caballi]